MVHKVEELTVFRGTDDFVHLVTAYERVSNLAVKAQQVSLEPSRVTPADKQFSEALAELEQNTLQRLEQKEYGRMLLEFAAFRRFVDGFFNDVMDDDDPVVRQNRLSLLRKTAELYKMYADSGNCCHCVKKCQKKENVWFYRIVFLVFSPVEFPRIEMLLNGVT